MIREATLEDIPKLIVLGEEFYKITCLTGVPFDVDSFIKTVSHLIQDEACVVFVDDDVNGGIGGMINPYWMNLNCIAATKVFWRVCDGNKHPLLGLKLLSKLEDWAISKGASTVQTALSESYEPKRICKILTRCGYLPHEQSFIKVLSDDG